MDPKLDILQHLYGEGGDEADLNRLLEDEALRAEYEALREAKNEVDRRPRPRPDPAVIERIMAAAAPASPTPLGQRADRPPIARRHFHRARIYGALGSTLVVVMLVGIGFWRSSSAPEPADVAAAEPALQDQMARRPPAAAEMKGFAEGQRLAEEESARRAVRSRPGSLAENWRKAAREALPSSKQEEGRVDLAAETSVPAWDEAEEVRRLFRRVEQLEARNVDLAWDEPPFLLEAAEPRAAGRWTPALQPTNQRRLEGFPP